ncbi:hypothetical protein FSP39_021660 [Pinctada imbricata]|uniref:Chitin-binding type-4 domain-containing protein n=1 Tax=Pinctada imbricata TaxID=66713 RepID=A0AA89C484_PINIB|nr:hypothetical protein FSP39_021660 [Pinctada imbricata]
MLICTVYLWTLIIDFVEGHGMMIEPPMRGSMWRYGFDTPKNYNDNGLNCGGFADMMSKGGGKCAPCGDPLWGPRQHEAGGKYATGTIARFYAAGQIINVTVELTSNHKGYFEFRLCPNNNPKVAVTQDCLDQFPLEILGYGHRYVIKSAKTVMVDLKLLLPPGLTCTQCVMQWKWRAAQNKGMDPKTGKECFGCGPQEYFINCADVSIGYEAMKPQPRQTSLPDVTSNVPTVKPTHPMLGMDPTVLSVPQQDPITGIVEAGLGVNKVGGGYFDLIDPHTLFVDPGHNSAPLTPLERSFLAGEPIQPVIQPIVPQSTLPPNNHLQTVPPSVGYVTPPLDPAYNEPLLMASGFDPKPKTKAKPTTMDNLMAAAFMTTMAVAAENTDNAYVECQEGMAQPTCTGNPYWGEGHNYDEYCSTMCPTGICPVSLCVCSCPGSRHGAQKPAPGKCRAIESWDPSAQSYCSQTCNTMNYGSDACPTELCFCENMWPM